MNANRQLKLRVGAELNKYKQIIANKWNLINYFIFLFYLKYTLRGKKKKEEILQTVGI